MKMINISMVENAFSTSTRTTDALAIINNIKQGRWREPVARIRRLYADELKRTGSHEEAKKAVDHLKKNLPGVMWSGTFSRRGKEYLLQHSGLFCGDIDADALGGKDLKEVRAKLRTSPYVVAVFLSPTGHGLKVIFRVPADASKHDGCFRAIKRHIFDLTGVQTDESGKDLARLCFVSADPDACLNLTAEEIAPRPTLQVLSDTHKPVNKNDHLGKPSKAEIREMLGFIPKRPEYEDWVKVVAAVGDALLPPDAIELLKEWSPEEEEGEYAYKLRKKLEDVHIWTLIYLAKQHGWTPKIDIDEKRPDLWKGSVTPPVELPPPPAAYVPAPLTLLPALLQEYVHAAAESLNVDVAFILLPLLSSLGTAIGNTRSILLKRDFIQPPIIWTSIIGESGTRKSPALEAGCFAITQHEKELCRQNRQAQEIYAEELAIWEANKKKGQKPEPPVLETCLMDDLTMAVLADVHDRNPRGVLVQKDELSHWFASFDQFTNAKGADVSRWLSLHTGVKFLFDRRTDRRSYRIFNPRANITGVIPPKVLKRVLTEDYFERGLPARILFAYPIDPQDKWTDAEIPDDLRKAVLDLFEQLWLSQPDHDDHAHPLPKLLPLSADAKALYVAFYNTCGAAAVEADEHGEYVWAKLSGYGARLALVGQLAHKPQAQIITAAIMKHSCELASWFGNEAVRIYAALAETREQREMRQLVDFVERRGREATVRDVKTNCRAFRDKPSEEIEKMFDHLVKASRGEWTKTGTTKKGGRPTCVFRLFPVSASAQPARLRGKMGGFADADTPNSQKITPATSPDAEPAGVSVPLVITRQMEAELRARGYSQSQINKLTPQQAREILATPATPASGSDQEIAADIVIGEDPEGETIL